MKRRRKGKILGTLLPGGGDGLERLFRNFGVELSDDDALPDLNQSVEYLENVINTLKKEKNVNQ